MDCPYKLPYISFSWIIGTVFSPFLSCKIKNLGDLTMALPNTEIRWKIMAAVLQSITIAIKIGYVDLISNGLIFTDLLLSKMCA